MRSVLAPRRSGLQGLGLRVLEAVSGTVHDQRMMLPINLWKFRCQMSADQSLASGAAHTVVNYDTLDYDNVDAYDTTNHQYVVRVTGVYFLAAQVLWNPTGVMTWFIGNANAVAGTTAGNVQTGTLYPVTIADSFSFNASDVVTVQATQQNSAALAQSIKGGATNSYWCMHLISG
jgi:hypothetical protein